MTKRLLLIDGHSMAYRAFFALPADNFTTAQGQHTNAIYGFATMLLSLLSSEKPTHVAVAFDVSRKTFRSEIFPEYKANRSKTPDEFRSQMSYLHELVTAFGITSFEVEGFEAWGGGEIDPLWEKRLSNFERILEEDTQFAEQIQESVESGAFEGITLNYQERRIYHWHEELDRRIGEGRIPPEFRVQPKLAPWIKV